MHGRSLYQSSLIETLHSSQAGSSQPHHRSLPTAPSPLLNPLRGSWHCGGSHQVKDPTWALRGSSCFITRALLSAGWYPFLLASLLRAPGPWDCGTICNTVQQTWVRMLMMYFQARGGLGSYSMTITPWWAIITLWIIFTAATRPCQGHDIKRGIWFLSKASFYEESKLTEKTEETS